MLLLLSLVSCAHVISRENREGAETDIPFSALRTAPDRYFDRLFIYGGIIASNSQTKDGTELEIVQTPLDRWGNTVTRDVSEGRFIVTAKRRLDPMIFKKGREITMSGALRRTMTKPLGEIDYVYPVFEAREISLKSEEVYPYPPDPYYSPNYPYYWYDPWFRPHLYFHFIR